MKANTKGLFDLAKEAHSAGKRLVAPLVGFPGCTLTGFSLKVAQQNHAVHFACIKALVDTLQPDIAFMLMDLSVEANALGLPVRFPTDESSTVEKHPVEILDDLDKYRRIDILRDSRILSYVKTVEMMRTAMPAETLVAAYVVGPLSLTGLLRSAQQIAMDSILAPGLLSKLCEFSTGVIQKYAAVLVNAGADIICILEPTAMMFGPEQFREFSGNYVRHIMESYKYQNVRTVYHICGNTMHLIKEIAATGVAGISLDAPEYGIDMQKAAEMVQHDVVILGNVSPTRIMTDGSPDDVRKATTELLENMRPYPNFILSTGCDIPQEAPLENLKVFMQTAREFE